MKKFIIEREIPGVGQLTPSELRAIACKSCTVIDDLDLQYHWLHTYVTDNRLYCVHIAPDEQTVREHSRQAGFPILRIIEVKSMMDPTIIDSQRVWISQYQEKPNGN